MTVLLEAKNVTLRFGGVTAVNDVSFGVGTNETDRKSVV